MIITTTFEITPRRIADLMVTAIEGGIGYWCKSVKLILPKESLFNIPWYDDERLYLETEEFIQIMVTEDDDEETHHQIGLARMKEAFKLMQEFGTPKGFHWRDFINENDDATTADVWFQLAVFGEVVYG